MHAYNNGESQNDNVESKSQVAFKRNPKSSQTPIGFLIYNRVALKVKTESRNLIKQTSTNLVYLRTNLKLNFNNIFNSSCNIVYLFPPHQKKNSRIHMFWTFQPSFQSCLERGKNVYINSELPIFPHVMQDGHQIQWGVLYTLPETNLFAPKNGWLEDNPSPFLEQKKHMFKCKLANLFQGLIRISTKKRVDDQPGYRRILLVFVHIVSHLGSLSPNQDVQVLTIEAWPPIEQCHLWRGGVFFSFWCGIL